MNKNQKGVTWGAISLFALTFLAVPWCVKEFRFGAFGAPMVANESLQYSTFWVPPNIQNAEVSIDAKSLLLEWLGIGVVYFAIFTLLKTKA